MGEAETSMQIELDSGRRIKVKAAQVLLRFAAPAPAEMLARAHERAAEIDLDLAWEFAPEAEFGFAELAREYFNANADTAQQAGTLLRLFEAPHYFRRLGKGQFRKAPEEVVKAALLGIERKKQVAAQIDAWADELAAGRCPPAVRSQLYKLLFRPDKNAAEYKAVVEAARRSQRPPLDLLRTAGAIDSPYQFHWQRFLFENFPSGTDFPALPVPETADALPRAEVRAFSIDDSQTTEIDDALSVEGIGSGRVVLGIHIAAPGLAIAPDSALDRLARSRLSTVYMPGHKLTMLPDDVVQAFTLQAGRDCPALSLYVTFDEASLAVLHSETRLERVPIAANLRHDLLDAEVSEASLNGEAAADYPFAVELGFAWRLARHLKAAREVVRGKPENFNRPDYSFRIDSADGAAPVGDEPVAIGVRRRGAPLDLVVAEAMILANSTWGGWLAECGVPGIYRSQASLSPGVKVRMGVKPAPHAGMGVAQYAWSTSPLRRYVDLVNQWQLIACARHGRTAALVAAFKPKDVALFSIISAFDTAYASYNAFQAALERYWTLRYLEQEGLGELDATVMKEGLVRADTLPLVFRALGAEALPRGARARVRIEGSDLLTLDVHARLLAQIDEAGAGRAGVVPDETEGEGEVDEAAEAAAGVLPLAIEIGDEDAEAAPAAEATPAI